MRRLAATLRCDVRLQARNGFYFAAAFVAAGGVLLLRWLDLPALARLLPALVLTNLIVGTFYFMGGLVLLEKAEGTLAAQVVTPLRTWEYLGSKVLTLTALSLAENGAIVAAVHGRGFAPLPLLAGIAAAAALFSLLGFLVVSRYDSVNEYLFPSFLVTALLPLPLVDQLGLWRSPLFDLHPAQAPLVLLAAAFEPAGRGRLAFGLLASAAWVTLAALAGRRAYRRFVRAGERPA